MKKNLPYFIVIAALVFLIIGVLSSGKQSAISSTTGDAAAPSKRVSPQGRAAALLEMAQKQEAQSGREAERTETAAVIPAGKLFNVYTDSSAPDNHYAPSGWMGDYGDITLDEKEMANPRSGATCIRVNYSGNQSQGAGWAGVYWQNPPNNWGDKMGGFDLSGYNKLTFWARGENGGEVIEKVKTGGIGGTYPDSLQVEFGPITLTQDWQKYTLNLSGQDLSYISGGFSWVTASRLNPEGATFYFDDIRFENEPGLAAELSRKEAMPFDVYSEISSAANHFIPSGWMGDTGDMKIDQGWTADPHSGTTCIRLVYSAQASKGARWAGMFWQTPENNWGQVKGAGFDLSQATRLTFWARGEKGGERIEEFKMGGISGDYPDSDVAGIGPVVLTPLWQQYTIDLSGKDLTQIIGGFCWATNVDVNPEGCVFYLDDIKYE